MGIREEITSKLISGTAENIDGIILAGLPDGFNHEKVSRQRFVGATFEIWSYDGAPFLELHDPQFKTLWDGREDAKVNVTINYRYLKPQS